MALCGSASRGGRPSAGQFGTAFHSHAVLMDADSVVNGLLCAACGALATKFCYLQQQEEEGGAGTAAVAVPPQQGQGRIVDLPDGSSGTIPSPSHVLTLCKHRRSIFPRDYSRDRKAEISREVLSHMLEAANTAPTHGITEPWRFVVLEGDAMQRLSTLKLAHAKEVASSAEEYEQKLPKLLAKEKKAEACAALIAICMKRVTTSKGKLMPEWEEIVSVASAVQNMHLMLAAHGLGGYWSSSGCEKPGSGWGSSAPIKRMLGMDGAVQGESDRVLGIFYVGAVEPQRYAALTSKHARKVGPCSKKVVYLR
eukprot:COSAG01_NODE_3654_length_5822_cov_64.763411_6_plen_310_part_00